MSFTDDGYIRCHVDTYINSISKAEILFAPKDYDFISSLPLSNFEIVISRLISQYIYEFFFVLIVFLPAVCMYTYLISPPLYFWILIIPTILLLPCIPTFIGGLVAVVITVITSRFRHKNLGTVIFGLLFVFAAMGFSSTMGMYANDEKIAEMGRLYLRSCGMLPTRRTF